MREVGFRGPIIRVILFGLDGDNGKEKWKLLYDRVIKGFGFRGLGFRGFNSWFRIHGFRAFG